jgi:prepilin-type processing-associated H-X9-DG protein
MQTRGFTFIQLLILIAVIAVAIAFLIPIIRRANERANLAMCSNQLRKIGGGLIQYANANNGALPVSAAVDGSHADLLKSLSDAHFVGDPHNYYCPSQTQADLRFSEANFASGIIGYYYYGALDAGPNRNVSKFLRSGVSWPRKLNTSMDPKTWVMSDIWISGVPTAHAGYRKGVNYLMLDGSVSFISGSPRQEFH